MQEGSGEADLRKLASKCRLSAGHAINECQAASLRKLAKEYDEAAEAQRELRLFNGSHLARR